MVNDISMICFCALHLLRHCIRTRTAGQGHSRCRGAFGSFDRRPGMQILLRYQTAGRRACTSYGSGRKGFDGRSQGWCGKNGNKR